MNLWAFIGQLSVVLVCITFLLGLIFYVKDLLGEYTDYRKYEKKFERQVLLLKEENDDLRKCIALLKIQNRGVK